MTASPSAADIDRQFRKAIELFQSDRLAEAAALLDQLALAPPCCGQAAFFRPSPLAVPA